MGASWKFVIFPKNCIQKSNEDDEGDFYFYSGKCMHANFQMNGKYKKNINLEGLRE